MIRKIISFVNHKGGVGKTTSAVNTAAALAAQGYNTLLIDTDAQLNASYHLLRENAERQPATTYNVLLQGASVPAIEVSSHLYLCPASFDLSTAEAALTRKGERNTRLARALSAVRDNFDYIIIDCPPSLGTITTNAIIASSDVYVPVTGEAFPLKGLAMITKYVSSIQREDGTAAAITGIVLTRYNNRRLNNAVRDSIATTYKGIVFDTVIRECIAVAEAPLTGTSIFEYAPKSNGASDYAALANEIIHRGAAVK